MENEKIEEFFPNLNETSRITKRGLGAQPILESQIKAAQEKSKSARQAAKTLGISYNTYKKYAKLYGIFEDLKKLLALNPGSSRVFILRRSYAYRMCKRHSYEWDGATRFSRSRCSCSRRRSYLQGKNRRNQTHGKRTR